MKPVKQFLADTCYRTRKELTTVDLITTILAIRVPITSPLLVNTLPRAALDFAGWAFGVYYWLAATLLKGLI
jgi:hypothetical protein